MKNCINKKILLVNLHSEIAIILKIILNSLSLSSLSKVADHPTRYPQSCQLLAHLQMSYLI